MNYLIEAIELHDTLNPKFWKSDMQLKPDVRQKVLEIVDEFKENVKDMTDIELNPLDIYIVGSNASYNYTDKSDLDVHIVINFDTIDDNTGLVQSLMNFQKSEFNNGYDITIYDTDVELYVEDINSSTMSNGIFSVMQDQWIKKPEPIEVPEIEGLEDAVDEWKDKINAALDSKDPKEISKTIDDLYILRKNSLLSGGEFSEGNQIFKDVRNLGLLGDLRELYAKLRSKELSLETRRVNNMCKLHLTEGVEDVWFNSIEREEESIPDAIQYGVSDKKIDRMLSIHDNVVRLLKANRSEVVFIMLSTIDDIVSPDFLRSFKPVKNIQKYNLTLKQDDKGNQLVTEPGYGTYTLYFTDEDTARDILSQYEFDWDNYDDEYTPSSTYGDYSPSDPWNAPGMSKQDFI